MANDVQPISGTTALAAARLCNFPTGLSNLLPSHKAWISQACNTIQGAPNPWCDIIGYASHLGSKAFNQKLSFARCDAVKSIVASINSNCSFPQEYGVGDTESTGTSRDNDGYWRAVDVYIYAVRPAVNPTPPVPKPPEAVRVCGPDVTVQYRMLLKKIQSDFRSWSSDQKKSACRRIIYPIVEKRPPYVPGTNPLTYARSIADIDGWDVLPLYQGASAWLRSKKVRECPCAMPTSSALGDDPFNDAHEDDKTCSDSVQVGDQCWLNGTVNYGAFGIMVRLCSDEFFEFKLARLEATGLIRLYKSLGDHPEGATDPLRWFNATYEQGPGGLPAGAGNRPTCSCKCPLKGDIVPWDYVWEPVKPRSSAIEPPAEP